MLPESVDVRSPFIISSIGSVPAPITGLPMKGELIDFEDWDTGRVRGLPHVFGLGNALTGKGNIKESRKNAQLIGTHVVESYLGLRGDGPLRAELDAEHAAVRAQTEAAIADAVTQPPLSPAQQAALVAQVKAHWARAGYPGDLTQWLHSVTPRGSEA
jgi:hypothetical protein